MRARVGDLPHVAGVEQAGAQGVLRPVEKEGALAQPAAVGIDKVAAQNDIHPVGHRLLRPRSISDRPEIK